MQRQDMCCRAPLAGSCQQCAWSATRSGKLPAVRIERFCCARHPERFCCARHPERFCCARHPEPRRIRGYNLLAAGLSPGAITHARAHNSRPGPQLTPGATTDARGCWDRVAAACEPVASKQMPFGCPKAGVVLYSLRKVPMRLPEKNAGATISQQCWHEDRRSSGLKANTHPCGGAQAG
eukprot:366499-Chlamydomonas_euryale.AAC.6